MISPSESTDPVTCCVPRCPDVAIGRRPVSRFLPGVTVRVCAHHAGEAFTKPWQRVQQRRWARRAVRGRQALAEACQRAVGGVA